MINQFQTVEDFIADESFQNFVLNNDSGAVVRWKAYQKNHPEHQSSIDEATQFVKLLAPQETITAIPFKSNNKKYLYLAALISCISVLITFYFLRLSANVNEPTLLTQVAHSDNINFSFPDDTKLVLRKGSTLKYYDDWSGEAKRKVWLDGEAYLDVSKAKDSKDLFQVQLEHGLVKVLGTKFLVRSVEEEISVILEEGKIECQVREQKIMMKPGDLLYANKEKVSVEHQHKARNFDSWRSGSLSFKNETIEEVIKTINNSYPISVSLGNPQLKNRKITATVDQNDPLLLLEAIAAIYDIKLIEETNQVILK